MKQRVIVAILCAVCLTGQLSAANEPDPLLSKAEEFVRKENTQATVKPIQSNNPHLGGATLIPQVVTGIQYYCAHIPLANAEKAGAPTRRSWVAVTASGKATFVKQGDVAEHLALQDKTRWSDDEYIRAARFLVHFTSMANEDGWKLLAKPDDFTDIKFNMGAVGPGLDKQRLAAQQIQSPAVTRQAAPKPEVRVTFYSWHLVGGALKKWTVTFAGKVTVSTDNLDAFGGGGYD